MEFTNKVTHYFRQSLIDAENLCPEDKVLLPALGQEKTSSDFVDINKEAWLSGRINSDDARRIVHDSQKRSRQKKDEVELCIYPRVDLLKAVGTRRASHKRSVLLPLAVYVKLSSSGSLKPSKKPPIVPRIWLSPNGINQDPIGEMTVLNDFITLNPFDGIQSWKQLTSYTTRLLVAVATGEPKPDENEESVFTAESIYDFYLDEHYEITQHCLIKVDSPITGATSNILKLLDHLKNLDETNTPNAYKNFCSDKTASIFEYGDLENNSVLKNNHYGQMSDGFPLSVKQRNAVHHLLINHVSEHGEPIHGEILAVNGPPGTGKTTLLQTVVANMWSEAALEEVDPPLIVATSNNNQAVTNILESFAKVDEVGITETLKGRWLPQVDSYGLFCCSAGKANTDNPYRYLGPKDKGCMEKWHTSEYFDEAYPYFMQKANECAAEEFYDVYKAKDYLHKKMLERKKIIIKGNQYHDELANIVYQIVSEFNSIEAFSDVIQEEIEQSEYWINQETIHETALHELQEARAKRNVFTRLFSWIPFVKNNELRSNKNRLDIIGIEPKQYSSDYLESYLNQQILDIKDSLFPINDSLATNAYRMTEYDEALVRMTGWINEYQPEDLRSTAITDITNEINDRVNRFTLFKYATHYWEARWLIEVNEFIKNKDSDKKSEGKTLRKLRRYAKLMPCFVSTFYMVPSTFMAGKFKDDNWADIPLLESIDLLILDEAGQASSEIAAASFSLAKRALVVGDTDQIAPVWSIQAGVDRSNLQLYGLLESQDDFDNEWSKSGLLASSGNAMRVAQRQSKYHQFEQLQQGLYLTEHRRCYDNIVGYCNDLVYQGILEPLRGEPKQEVPWGTMTFIPVESDSSSMGGSRGNAGEAKAIAEWINNERNTIVEYARSTDAKFKEQTEEEILKSCVGIISPFKKQANLIQSELRRFNITNLTVGTVHSLQGDERLIVLFSSVYGKNEKDGSKFYDDGPSMLNVAVSRAKDSFIVFGNKDVFGTSNSGTPSDLLRASLVIRENLPKSVDNDLQEIMTTTEEEISSQSQQKRPVNNTEPKPKKQDYEAPLLRKMSNKEKQADNLLNNRPINAGLPWTDEQRQQLTKQFNSKESIGTIAKTHGRTQGAIRSELKKLELVNS